MKIVLIICDGLGDRPIKDIGFRTPLEASRKPSMDFIAANGICGIMDPIAPGVRPGSAPAHLAIFGYNPYECYRGRGVFEALGLGVDVKPGDLTFRVNLATVDGNLTVIDRRAGRIGSDDSSMLFRLLNEELRIPGVEVYFYPGVEHRGVLVIRGEGLSWMVSDTDPERDGASISMCRPLDESIEARRTAELVNRISIDAHRILSKSEVNRRRASEGKLQANAILVRGASFYEHVSRIDERYGLKACCIAGGPLYKGVARYLGMDVIEVKGATGTYESDFKAKVEACTRSLENYDLVYLHFKATDLAGEDGNYRRKIEMIERIDDALYRIIDRVEDCIITLTADHSTPCSIRTHSADPVPVAIAGPDIRVDDVGRFEERLCAKGGLNRIRGLDLMPILLDVANLTHKYGA
ncbi:MAG: 2,3-bisphosphoglycerate-independent phosphoglycerate mutase [Nitrososphaerota archaeon]|nr:2,3-bisphosphoglycerate-independent phosphoglycerate mutase [Candidatus Bathyarchaeota archaeon]MCX8162771.1 2,3-bisphosphoglycerate-independent phosphoglycerate mutase [Candidatus Bathyarchaeota archaeon]MDW8061366.1 2,3-bisphosphoglycerate-independent phosphoglycerate mutase [Nitrososphaerota archaeon]